MGERLLLNDNTCCLPVFLCLFSLLKKRSSCLTWYWCIIELSSIKSDSLIPFFFLCRVQKKLTTERHEKVVFLPDRSQKVMTIINFFYFPKRNSAGDGASSASVLGNITILCPYSCPGIRFWRQKYRSCSSDFLSSVSKQLSIVFSWMTLWQVNKKAFKLLLLPFFSCDCRSFKLLLQTALPSSLLL